MTIYGNQGLTVSVPVEDERIQKDALYALEVDEMLSSRADIQVKPTLLWVQKQGELNVITNIQSPCLQ